MSSLYMGVRIFGTEAERTDRHRLSGTVLYNGVPVKRTVFVLRRDTMDLVGTTISDEVTGHWEILGMVEYPLRNLIVIAWEDSTKVFNSKLYDFVSQTS